ncbi:4Fe-4S dicluster domain-containing protein [Thermosulfurimonas dismutans]|uniref:Cytochrome c nitrite reductase, 4Fe-4S ferredoxin subunit NrfC n=1 Tax=Thermosulfurimonas dismutans TaxID=999894 RepID=A0A179D3P9_9BACT|nr:4Fe-4S dicluster domain-containing protein [Thermosulfurimonas dismutans]OAQ20687.1 Cytochrome c nitrite reductase, 4Fe-4S ferredoxin subunit NrfC [Thermosulfurimonas dismutans]
MYLKDFAKWLKSLKNEGVEHVSVEERRKFLKMGLVITGVYAGGTLLSVVSKVNEVYADIPEYVGHYPYKPHYSMVLRTDRCIDCERCMEACRKTNHVPSYGWRTRILEQHLPKGEGEWERRFMPILCNHCNEPPCVRACPTRATYKDKKTGIVRMNVKKCIGCKTCMAACPYNMRYFNEEKRAIDKCDFCWESRLSKGEKITACAQACPAKVRIFGDLSDPESEVFQLVHDPQRAIWVLRPEVGARPNVFYTIN